MALRDFTDATGCRWQVWETTPPARGGLPEDYRGGWLTFDNGTERRRFAPVPEEWALLPPERLAVLARAAVRVVRRPPPGAG
jgi:hypothetical protein